MFKITDEGLHQNDVALKLFRVVFEVSGGDYYCGKIVASATGNCQISSYRYFNKALTYLNSKNVEELVRAYKALCKRPILILDIELRFLPLTKALLGKGIITETPYLNSNGSNMVIILFNTDLFLK